MQSVSKTITSVILGVAITRGDFKASLKTPVLKYFDVAKVKNVDDRKRHITVENLLTMTSLGDQELMVFPRQNLIVVFTGWYVLNGGTDVNLLLPQLLPAVKVSCIRG